MLKRSRRMSLNSTAFSPCNAVIKCARPHPAPLNVYITGGYTVAIDYASGHIQFETYMLDGLEWQQVVAVQTATGKYRIEITWALDRYRVSVYRRVQEPEKLVRVHHPLYARTAVATANSLLRYYEQNGY
jgi:hypothetical protein